MDRKGRVPAGNIERRCKTRLAGGQSGCSVGTVHKQGRSDCRSVSRSVGMHVPSSWISKMPNPKWEKDDTVRLIKAHRKARAVCGMYRIVCEVDVGRCSLAAG